MAKPVWLIATPVLFLILWSAGFGIAKTALTHAEPLTILALRYVLVLVLLAPVALVLRPRLPSRTEALHIAIVGFLIQVVYYVLCYMAFKSGVSAGGVAIIVCLQPILVALAAPWTVGEKIGLRGWLGLILGLTGAALAILGRSAIAAESLIGVGFAVGGLLGMTTATLWEKRFGTTQHPVTTNLIQYAVGAAVTLPAAWATESMTIHWDGAFIWAMAYLVIGNSILALSLLLAMIRVGEVARVSSLFFLVPPLSALIAWPLLGEAMPPLGWVGMGLAALGVALVSRKLRLPARRIARTDRA